MVKINDLSKLLKKDFSDFSTRTKKGTLRTETQTRSSMKTDKNLLASSNFRRISGDKVLDGSGTTVEPRSNEMDLVTFAGGSPLDFASLIDGFGGNGTDDAEFIRRS
jgi:hypothetical protein